MSTPESLLGLARIDLQTLKLIPIGTYDKIPGRAEMTGTGDGRLFAAFAGSPYIVAEIGKTDAKVLSQAPQANVNGDALSFAFALARARAALLIIAMFVPFSNQCAWRAAQVARSCGSCDSEIP